MLHQAHSTTHLLKVLLHFDLALLLFLGLGFCFGYKNDLATVLKAVIAWSKLSVGNSNWFIFTTFCLYIIVFLAFFFYKERIQNLKLMTLGIYVVSGISHSLM